HRPPQALLGQGAMGEGPPRRRKGPQASPHAPVPRLRPGGQAAARGPGEPGVGRAGAEGPRPQGEPDRDPLGGRPQQPGRPRPPGTSSGEDAMERGLLGGWNVRKTPLTASVPVYGPVDEQAAADAEMLGLDAPEPEVLGHEEIPIENRFAVVRNNPVVPGQIDPLGVVGSQYAVIQNEAHAEFLNTLVEESGAHFETAGAIAGGRKVFLTMKLPEH